MNYNDLIAKKMSGEISSEEEIELSTWLNFDDYNKSIFEHAKKLWEISRELNKGYNPDTEKEWVKFNSKIKSIQTETKIIPLKNHAIKIAAGVIVIIASFFLFKFITSNDKSIIPTIQLSEIKTTDSVFVFYLSDSSRVYLNKNSTFKYPTEFSEKERIVSLDGEAFFEIRHNGSPFIITCNNTTTKVLGTSFNINGYRIKDGVEVEVITGKVEFSNEENKSKKTVLNANEKGKFDYKTGSIGKSKNNKGNNWWKTGNANHKIKEMFNKLKRKIK